MTDPKRTCAVSVEPNALDEAKLKPACESSAVGLGVRDPKWALDELMSQCDLETPMNEQERAWLDEPPVGREIL